MGYTITHIYDSYQQALDSDQSQLAAGGKGAVGEDSPPPPKKKKKKKKGRGGGKEESSEMSKLLDNVMSDIFHSH